VASSCGEHYISFVKVTDDARTVSNDSNLRAGWHPGTGGSERNSFPLLLHW